MRHRHAAALGIAALMLLAATPLTAALSDTRVFLPNASVTLQLGQEQELTVPFQNPLDRTDTYEVRIDTEPAGNVIARPIQRGGELVEDSFSIDLASTSNHTTTLSLLGARCLGDRCDVTVTIAGRSLETDERFSKRLSVTLERDQDVYGGPGIQLLQLLLIAATGTLLVARR